MYTYMQNFSPFYSPSGPGPAFALFPFLALIVLWTIAIKGYALWHAARNGQKWWFVALLVINTVGILEVVYLIWFSPKGSNKLNSYFSRTPAHDSSPQ
jgi:methionyl-tRNA synthetase